MADILGEMKKFFSDLGLHLELGIRDSNLGACTGEWIESEHPSKLVSVNPTDGEPVANILQADEAAYEKVMAAATGAFPSWRMMPAPARGEVVRELGNELRVFKEPLGRLVSLEMGKILSEGLGEVQEMIDMCDFAVGLSRQLYGPNMMSERPRHRMYEQWHPLGVVGIITAFNFPVAVWAWNAALAAVCGNTMVWKPSSDTPLTAVAVQHICNRVMKRHGLEGVFNLVIGPGRTIGELMVNDPRVPLISFTGSTAMGRHVAEATARRFGRSILELGGNNAIIVAEDADLELAVRAILFAAVGTAGQRCTSLRRLFLHKNVAKQVIDRLLKAYPSIPIGNPLEEGVLMGPLVNERAVEDHLAALDKVREQGGEILYGGGRPERPGFFVEPTIVKAQPDLAIAREETFAPILYVFEFENLEQAIAMHNSVDQGLSSAIFTDSLRAAERFLSHEGSDCGIANVNIGTS
ncbi:MAG TPA: aldehyde dehydrogenase family protein, partial [Chondromyces sp.]|nr:aldehyde dehydrogenase family protein [Chondromyces sp.]